MFSSILFLRRNCLAQSGKRERTACATRYDNLTAKAMERCKYCDYPFVGNEHNLQMDRPKFDYGEDLI